MKECLYCEKPMFKRAHIVKNMSDLGKVFYHCDGCGRDFDENNIVDKDGNRLNDKGEPIGETTP